MRIPQDSHRTAVLAYQIWEQEGRPAGRDQDHWQQAEMQLQVEFRMGFPDATGDEDPDGFLPSSDSERATAERNHEPVGTVAFPRL